jgi:hypothetical protein
MAATPGTNAAIDQKRLTAAEMAHRKKRIWTMAQFEMGWKEVAAIERVSVRTAKRAAREWQQFLARCEGAGAGQSRECFGATTRAPPTGR